MEHINNLLDRPMSSTSTTPTGNTESEADRQLINNVFDQLITIKTAWKQSVHTDAAKWGRNFKRELMIALEHSGITASEMVYKGLDRARLDKSPFMITPGAFVALCKPTGEDLGLLPELEAYQQAIAHRKADRAPEVVFTMQSMGGSYDFGQKVSLEARKQFNDWYSKTVDHVLKGGKLPKPVLEIEDKPVPSHKSKGLAALRAIQDQIPDKDKPPILQPAHFPEAVPWDKKVPLPRVSTPTEAAG